MTRARTENEHFIRAVVKQGANQVLRRAGFKRPGGGWGFHRERALGGVLGDVVQSVYLTGWWRGATDGTLHLGLAQRSQAIGALNWHRAELPLDLVHGDAGDSAIELAHWLAVTALPWFEQPFDFRAIARDAELEGGWWTEQRYTRLRTLWELAGDEAKAAHYRREPSDFSF